MAGVWVTRGALDRAMALYEQSAAIDEQLGDLQGKSATLHAMANVYVTRGDLDGAMRLYEESLALQEQLGERLDLPASAITEAVIEEHLRPRGAPETVSRYPKREKV